MELKIEYLPVGELKAYDRNTRKHQDKDVTEIAKSIEKYGFSDPIGVWGEKNIIVEGHGRLLAARKLGIETVPVIHLDHLTDEERREYAIMHNRTAELSGWDFEMLAKEMEELDLSEFDLDIAGFDMEENDFDTQELEEVEAPEPPAEPTAKPGQIYQLGRHRLMCGDSTKKDEKVLDLFGGSGTTLMAAEQIKRRCYMMEFDPRYVDVIIQRWEEFTGRKAELIN